MTGWDAEWKALRENFAGLTAKRFLAMEELLARLSGPQAGKADLEELNRHFHSLKGVGASYGYPGITSLGKYSQQECRALIEEGKMPTAEDLKRLQGRIDDMKRELAAGGTGGGLE